MEHISIVKINKGTKLKIKKDIMTNIINCTNYDYDVYSINIIKSSFSILIESLSNKNENLKKDFKNLIIIVLQDNQQQKM